MASPPDAEIPKLVANERLRAFRAEGGLSWAEVTQLWQQICHFINAPSNDVLLDPSRAGKGEYQLKLAELTGDIFATGLFGPGTRGRWHSNVQAHQQGIYTYIGGVTAYAGEEVMKQVPLGNGLRSIEADKVGGWLMNQEATNWNDYSFVPRPLCSTSEFAPTVTNPSHTSFRSTSTIIPEIVLDAVNNVVDSGQ